MAKVNTVKSIFFIIIIPFQFIYGLIYFLFYLLVLDPIRKVARFLLKNELKREKSNNESLILLLREKDEKIKELEKIEKKYNYLVSFGSSIKNSKGLIYFDVTLKGEPVLISYDHYNDMFGAHLSLYLYKFEDNLYGPNTKIYGSVHVLYDGDSKIRLKNHTVVDLKKKECRYLYIHDFISSVEKEGYGSTLLNFLFKICIELKIECIVGELAYIDRENFVYTVPFYKKKGFEVYLSEDKQEGAIVKYINIKN